MKNYLLALIALLVCSPIPTKSEQYSVGVDAFWLTLFIQNKLSDRTALQIGYGQTPATMLTGNNFFAVRINYYTHEYHNGFFWQLGYIYCMEMRTSHRAGIGVGYEQPFGDNYYWGTVLIAMNDFSRNQVSMYPSMIFGIRF